MARSRSTCGVRHAPPLPETSWLHQAWYHVPSMTSTLQGILSRVRGPLSLEATLTCARACRASRGARCLSRPSFTISRTRHSPTHR